jgi:hypothetical protein
VACCPSKLSETYANNNLEVSRRESLVGAVVIVGSSSKGVSIASHRADEDAKARKDRRNETIVQYNEDFSPHVCPFRSVQKGDVFVQTSRAKHSFTSFSPRVFSYFIVVDRLVFAALAVILAILIPVDHARDPSTKTFALFSDSAHDRACIGATSRGDELAVPDLN